MAEDNIDLTLPFTSFQSCRNTFDELIEAFRNTDPAFTVLALQGLYHIENDKVKSGQFDLQEQQIQEIRNFLRVWRCNSQLTQAYGGAFKRVPLILRSLTIYQTFDVPLFIDDYGKKKLLSDYDGGIEDIRISGSTPIYHVTHCKEAQDIVDERRLKPSDNKNIIEGCWFGLSNSPSVYGSKSFATTLSQLGVIGLHQGEIVFYKEEVNVILYAAVDTDFEGLKKPTNEAAKAVNDPDAYVTVSIFVPSRFLPRPSRFWEVFRRPSVVKHGSFCVKAKRSFLRVCPDRR